MKFSSTKNLFAGAIILLAALLVANYFLFSFVREASAEAAEARSSAELFEQGRGERGAGGGQRSVDFLIEKINSYFVGGDEAVSLIEEIEDEARETGVSLFIRSAVTEPFMQAATPGESPTESSKIEIIRLKIETTGNWKNTLRLVSFIEHLPYKVVLEDVSLAKLSAGASGANGSDLLPVSQKGSSAKALASSASSWRGSIELTVLKHK